jgi:hypothetical protein
MMELEQENEEKNGQTGNERECKSTEMREHKKKLDFCLLFEKNLILQLLFQALQKYITRFLKKYSLLFFFSTIAPLHHYRWNAGR